MLNCRVQAVHPHGRGDNYDESEASDVIAGSPPRAWGQSVRAVAARRVHRFTPTGVGTITAVGRAGRAAAVHPHGRGDNRKHLPRAGGKSGSPPRAWGQLCRSSSRHNSSRFTPTGVGTMSEARTLYRFVTVHPHGRGDNNLKIAGADTGRGSPPRAWGQFLRFLSQRRELRFTPTGVGTIATRPRQPAA